MTNDVVRATLFFRAFDFSIDTMCFLFPSVRFDGIRAANASYSLLCLTLLYHVTRLSVRSCVSSTFAVTTVHFVQYDMRLPIAFLAAVSCMHCMVSDRASPENIRVEAYDEPHAVAHVRHLTHWNMARVDVRRQMSGRQSKSIYSKMQLLE